MDLLWDTLLCHEEEGSTQSNAFESAEQAIERISIWEIHTIHSSTTSVAAVGEWFVWPSSLSAML